MMETGIVVKVKEEPINSDEDGTYSLPLQDEDEDEDDGTFIENEAKQSKKSKDVSQPSTPPYYTQNHNVGGKWKVSKEKKQYNCKTCKFKFTSKAWLIKHERMHENMENKAKLYKCEICRKEFAQKIIYHDHMAAHAGRRPYVCDRCGMDFTWYRAFYRHQQSHKTGGQEFSCHLCHRTFNSNWNLSRHLKEIHLSQQTFKCDRCEELFEKKNLYQIHMKAHDREERERRKKKGIVSEQVKQKHLKLSKVVRAMVQSKSQNNNQQVNIQDSAMSYDNEITASELIETISVNSEVDETNVSDVDEKDVEFLQNVSEPAYTDTKCFVDTSDAIVGEIESQDIDSAIAETIIESPIISNQKLKPQPYTCDICEKRVYNLDAHLRIHSGDKPFRCCLCDKDFAQREALKIHYRSHTGEKPFVCSTCGKGFATRGLQQDHIRAHRGDKPYQCDVCDARFSWRCALSRHKQLHSTGPKPHSCSVCTFECYRKHDLTKHEKTHLYDNHYQCDFGNCTAVFSNKKHFVKHKKEHKSSKSSVSPQNGRITRTQTADNADQGESDANISTGMSVVVDIKQEPVDEFEDDEHHALDMNTSGTSSMYITSNEGQMETTLVTHATEEETDPESGKLRYTKGKRLHLNHDLQLLLSKKLNEKKIVETRITGARSSSECLEPNNKDRIYPGLTKPTPSKDEVEDLNYKKNQVTVSMDDVEKDFQRTKTFGKSTSNSNLVCCEVCGKSLNISYYHIHVRKHMEEMAHTCEICNKSFSRKTDLTVHSRVHTNIRPFQCTICPKAFKVKSLLEDHVRSHDGIKPYVCSLCDASFAWRCALHRHVQTHSIKKPFQCDVCGKDFRRRRDWTGHTEKKTCKFVKSIIYKCNDCQAVFANLETLVYHNEKFHKEPSLNVLGINTEAPPLLDTSSDITKEQSSDSMLSTSNKMKDSSERFDEESLPDGNDSVDEQNTSIETCENVPIASGTDTRTDVIPSGQFVLLTNTKSLDRADSAGSTKVEGRYKTNLLLAETSSDIIKKEYVDSDSIFISNVVNSIESMKDAHIPSNTEQTIESIRQQHPDHIDKTTLPLDTDEFSFINWTGGNLQIEPSSVITGVVEEKLKCKICGRTFVSSIGLKVHLRIHSKDAMDIYALHFRPDEMMTKSKKEREARNLKYKCKLCDKTFPFASGLRIHMMAHSGKLPYNCKTCGKRFPYLESVKSHMRVHTGERPFTCDVCGKSFAYRHNHDDHYRTHTGDKPYKCDRCDSSFTWKSALHRHHKTHSLESLEVCTICKAKFKNGGQLVRHMNRFHSSLL